MPLDIIFKLEQIKYNSLLSELSIDQHKLAFWINIYNAFYQILYKHYKIDSNNIYTAKEITIANRKFSLDDVEHGILRKYRYKYSLGYFSNFMASDIIKELAVDKIDYRIHFALNCGAVSCPPIYFYSADKIEEQLELATLSFLESEVKVIDDKKQIEISQLFKWFKADFGSEKGIREILKNYLKIDFPNYKLTYSVYNWQPHLANFNEISFN